jgi:YebC/PmpR family DNA-binding regulatory protein
MPKDNIQRAIKAGCGELKGGNLEESVYEGYAAGGVAVLCEILTDNRNRTAPEIRKLFELCDGKLGATGCVAYLFTRTGMVRVPSDSSKEDHFYEVAIESGADDVTTVDSYWEVACDPQVMSNVVATIKQADFVIESSEIIRVPSTTVEIDDVATARKVLNLMERLDDHDDVQSVSANFSIPDEALSQLE